MEDNFMSNENNTFSYSYSGANNDEIRHIKEKYTPKQVDEKMKKIRLLDKSVDFFSTILSILIGIFGTCFLIGGTIIIIKELLPLTQSIALAFFGLIVIAVVPFLHSRFYNVLKKHYGPRILSLIEEIEHN